jgi:hypothetical protein
VNPNAGDSFGDHLIIACVLAIAVIAFILGVRTQGPARAGAGIAVPHLDERKAAIYENLRDLQFEYRVGKLSDQDYQNTKKDLQKELAAVLAEVDALKGAWLGGGAGGPAPSAKPRRFYTKWLIMCPSCGAKFEKELKFCGECGKPMKVAQA